MQPAHYTQCSLTSMRPAKPTSTELKLLRENDTLKTEIICLRRELTNKQGHVARLEYLLCPAPPDRRSHQPARAGPGAK
jgi:hypothetical protein